MLIGKFVFGKIRKIFIILKIKYVNLFYLVKSKSRKSNSLIEIRNINSHPKTKKE